MKYILIFIAFIACKPKERPPQFLQVNADSMWITNDSVIILPNATEIMDTTMATGFFINVNEIDTSYIDKNGYQVIVYRKY